MKFIALLEAARSTPAQSDEVAAAAKAKGFTELWYHGTRAKFNTFEPSLDDQGRPDIGIHMGTKKQAAKAAGVDWSYGKDKSSPSVRAFYVKKGKYLKTNLDNEMDASWTHWPTLLEMIADAGYKNDAEELEKKAHEMYAKFDAGEYDKKRIASARYHHNEYELENPDIANDIVKDWLIRKGFAGIQYRNKYEGKGWSLAVFDTKHIKLADSVTYDDSGRPIPIEQRFDATKDDIRY